MFSIMHLYGDGETDPPLMSLSPLYDELADADEEHGDVSVTNDAGWCLSAFAGGLLIFEHLERGEERHMRNVSKERVIRLWELLIAGDTAAVAAEPWKSGYGS